MTIIEIFQPGLFMNTCYVVRSTALARNASFGSGIAGFSFQVSCCQETCSEN